MRLKATKRGFSLLVGAFLALALAACGGGSDSSLRADLDAANARIGSADEPDSLEGMLADANERIGSADDPMSLLGMLAAKTGEVTDLQSEMTALMTTLGDETNPDPASVRGMLAAKIDELTAAMERIGSADDPASLLGMIAAEQAEVMRLTGLLDDANDRIAMLEGGTDPVQLTPIRDMAKTASDHAAGAAADADTAAGMAETAADNRATQQTGEADSTKDAGLASAAATTAMEEAGKALAAYNAAVAAGDATAANMALSDAQTAAGKAEDAQTAAETARDDAVAAAAVELKIDVTVKSVGETTIDANAGASVVAEGEGDDKRTTRTGQIPDMTPRTKGNGVAVDKAVEGKQDDPVRDGNQAVKHVQAVADREFGIGKVVDAANDAARLMIITKYAGTNDAYVYNAGTVKVQGTKAGYISIKDKANNVRLASRGMFFAAGVAGGVGDLTARREVADTTKATEVFSYIDISDNKKKYVVLTNESTTSGTTTYTYTNVDVEVTVKKEGTNKAFETRVRAAIPVPADYDHIHFGVWAALKKATASGSQGIADHGIGFVQNWSGEGMTGADMPNNGTGEYLGNWAATVESESEDGNGAINLRSGDASVSADFGKGTIKATLTALATLEGDVTGNTFSGTKASGITAEGLDADADFDGSFDGAFYGSKAAEAGGVFDFASDDGEGGAFRGAFGGQRTNN